MSPVQHDRATPTVGAEPQTSGSGVGLVWLAGAVFLVVALATVGLSRELRWDEVTYLAQVTPGQPDVWFGPQRARGMTVVLLPVALLGAPLGLLRGWLLLVHSAALVAAFLPWVRAAGPVGGVAALVAAVGWVPLYFSVEAYPNLLAAFAVVAAAGWTLRWLRSPSPGWTPLVAAGLAIALVASLRPIESVWIAAALTPVVLLWRPREAWRAIAAFAAGGLLGWLPWLVEATVRFGGPLERVATARAASASSAPRNSLIQYLNLIEGPVRRVVADPVLTGRALLFLTLFAALAMLGIAQRRDPAARSAALLGAWTATALATPYLVLNAGINLRYVLPAMLLATVPVGGGLLALARWLDDRHRTLAVVALLAVSLPITGWQVLLARHNSDAIADLQARPVALGAALVEASDGAPCAFLSGVQWPEIQWHSGCLGEVLDPDHPTLQCHDARRDLSELAEQGYRVFVLGRDEPPFSPAVSAWAVAPLPEVPGGWWLYERPEDAGPDDPPTVPPPETSTTPCPPSRAPDTDGAQLRLPWTTADEEG